MNRDQILNRFAKLAATCNDRPTKNQLERWSDAACSYLDSHNTDTICAALAEFHGANSFPTIEQIETACQRLERAAKKG